MLFIGDTNRAVAETPLNLASSRSHCIFTVSVEGREEGSSVVRHSKLHLVDLAGSERTGKTNSSGLVFREATHINKSLHYLCVIPVRANKFAHILSLSPPPPPSPALFALREMVIVALHEARRAGGRSHIPYRNSLMTSVLRDSLGGNCKTTMIATINPEAEHTDESISTCRFAQRVARVQNCATVNEVTDPAVLARQLKARVAELEQEIAFRVAAVDADGVPVPEVPLTDADRVVLTGAARAWVDAPADAVLDLGSPLSMERIRGALIALKGLVLEERDRSAAHSTPAPIPEDSQLLGALREEVRRLNAKLLQRDGEVTALLERLNLSARGSSSVDGNTTVAVSAARGTATLPSLKQQPAGAPRPTPAASVQLAPLTPPTFLTPDGTVVTLALLQDRDRALEVFKGSYAALSPIEDNKALLRARYEDAKTCAEEVNTARLSIGKLKSEIERTRMERAVANIAREGGVGDDAIADEALLSSLENEKNSYKTGYDRLRTLKTEIEQIQRLLEGARLRLQADFETWHADACARLAVAAATPLPAPAPLPASAPPFPAHLAPMPALPVSAPGTASLNTSMSSVGSIASRASSAPALPPAAGATSLWGVPSLGAHVVGAATAHSSSSRSSISAPSGGASNVEADIAAFYAIKGKSMGLHQK